MAEPRETRLRRLRMRSWRRGTREADLILGPYADHRLASMTAAELEDFEALLSQNDVDIYAWISERTARPQAFAAALDQIGAFHRLRGDGDSH